MKSLKPLCFVLGMTGMFSMVVPGQMEWLAALPVAQSSALALLLSLALAAALSWLTQFRRRHFSVDGALQAFAACGVLVAALLPITALELIPTTAAGTVAAVLRLALFALFCLVAVKTQPASEQVEGAL